MLLFLISLFVAAIGTILAGVKLANKIKDIEIKIFFWVLYGITILTLFLVAVCIYIFLTFRKKSGPLGPRGFEGSPGDKGDSGSCDQNLCRARTLAVLMEKIIEEFNQEGVNQDVRKNLCGYVTHAEHPSIFKKWELIDVKIFRDVFTQQVNMIDGKINENNIQDVLANTTTRFNGKYDNDTKRLKPPETGSYSECQ